MNTTATGATNASACVGAAVCPPGTGGPACGACEAGSWSPGGNASLPRPNCTSCPPGFTTASANSNSRAACNRECLFRWHGAPLGCVGCWTGSLTNGLVGCAPAQAAASCTCVPTGVLIYPLASRPNPPGCTRHPPHSPQAASLASGGPAVRPALWGPTLPVPPPTWRHPTARPAGQVRDADSA